MQEEGRRGGILKGETVHNSASTAKQATASRQLASRLLHFFKLADIESSAYRVGVCCCIPHKACRADACLHRRHLGQLHMGRQMDGWGQPRALPCGCLSCMNDKGDCKPHTSLAAGPCTLANPTALIDTEGLLLSNDTWGALEIGQARAGELLLPGCRRHRERAAAGGGDSAGRGGVAALGPSARHLLLCASSGHLASAASPLEEP